MLCVNIEHHFQLCVQYYNLNSGGSKGSREGRPPGGPNSFNFMQFLGKFGKIVCWHLPRGVGAPPWGNPGSATAESDGLSLPPQTKFVKVMFLQLSVILFRGGGFCIQGGSASKGGGLHPEGLHRWGRMADPPNGYYGIRSTNGRYASYWNAFLFLYAISFSISLGFSKENDKVLGLAHLVCWDCPYAKSWICLCFNVFKFKMSISQC